jgi:ureidoglycolate lyase
MQLLVQPLTQAAFGEFGQVLGEPTGRPTIADRETNVWLGFADLLGIGAAPGCQATYLKVLCNPVAYDSIEKHETSAEAFIPLEGQSVLMVVPADAVREDGSPDMARVAAFLLDGTKGVLLRRGTWHAVPFSLSPVATFLVLVDDRIIALDDLHKHRIEPVEFVLRS